MLKMKEARIFILLGKKLSNEATDNELAELGQLLQDESVQPYLLEMVQEIWQKKAKVNEKELDEKWERTVQRFQTEPENGEAVPLFRPKTKKMYFFRAMVAACVAGLVLLSVWLLYASDKQKLSAVVVAQSRDSVTVALKGERKKIMLPDSTEVHLNSGSSLVYNKDFGNKNREVWLKGEAFFEVTKDASHPFLVNTKRMMVKVLGTVFNVKAYNTKEDIETTVLVCKV
jgi:ferric-dicitrate binding protein FerR (iron transport regulator)